MWTRFLLFGLCFHEQACFGTQALKMNENKRPRLSRKPAGIQTQIITKKKRRNKGLRGKRDEPILALETQCLKTDQ